MLCDDCFRAPACLVAHRAHALRSELDEDAVRKMGQAWLVAVGHDDEPQYSGGARMRQQAPSKREGG